MYNRKYEDGFFVGRTQGHKAGYDEAESEWKRKGEDIGYNDGYFDGYNNGHFDGYNNGYNNACIEAADRLNQKDIKLHNYAEYALQLEASIAQLEERAALQDQQIERLLTRNSSLESQVEETKRHANSVVLNARQQASQKLKTNIAHWEAKVAQQDDQINQLLNKNTALESRNKELQQNAGLQKLKNHLHMLEAKSVQAQADADNYMNTLNVMLHVINATALVASAACAAIEEYWDAAERGQTFELRDWFSRLYYERLELAFAMKIIQRIPESDPDLSKWVPDLSGFLQRILNRRVAMYAPLALHGPQPAFVTSLYTKDGELHPVLMEQGADDEDLEA